MKTSLILLIVCATFAGGCAVERTPLANVAPSYSYHEQGLVLGPVRPGHDRAQLTSAEARSIHGAMHRGEPIATD